MTTPDTDVDVEGESLPELLQPNEIAVRLMTTAALHVLYIVEFIKVSLIEDSVRRRNSSHL
jgi:hypothetical protein